MAGRHLTTTLADSVYLGVVSLRGLKVSIIISELDYVMVPWTTAIGNMYLEVKTTEKVYIQAWPWFGEIEGHKEEKAEWRLLL